MRSRSGIRGAKSPKDDDQNILIIIFLIYLKGENMRTLNDVKPGETVTLVKFHDTGVSLFKGIALCAHGYVA